MSAIDKSRNIIAVDHLSFSYNQTSKEQVLSDINLKVYQGDYLGIIGPNGGGKTTLLKLILGLLKPTSGSIKLFGQNISQFRQWSKIGYVPQKATSFDTSFPATVFEVVAMGRYAKIGLFHWPTSKDREVVKKALTEVGMLEYKSRLVGQLSGGQQQRVFIARALAAEPEAIFLDEPTVGVDQKTQDDFYALLKRLNRTLELTLVVVSHDIDVVAKEVVELACINKTLVYDGSPKEFFQTNLSSLYGEGVKLIKHSHHGH